MEEIIQKVKENHAHIVASDAINSTEDSIIYLRWLLQNPTTEQLVEIEDILTPPNLRAHNIEKELDGNMLNFLRD